MGLFRFFRLPDIHQGVKEYQKDPGAVLLDVRTAQEYGSGHIPGSRNLPLQDIGRVALEKDTALYVYCQSGVRSRRAAEQLREMGYTKVHDIGGIAAYSGKVER